MVVVAVAGPSKRTRVVQTRRPWRMRRVGRGQGRGGVGRRGKGACTPLLPGGSRWGRRRGPRRVGRRGVGAWLRGTPSAVGGRHCVRVFIEQGSVGWRRWRITATDTPRGHPPLPCLTSAAGAAAAGPEGPGPRAPGAARGAWRGRAARGARRSPPGGCRVGSALCSLVRRVLAWWLGFEGVRACLDFGGLRIDVFRMSLVHDRKLLGQTIQSRHGIDQLH